MNIYNDIEKVLSKTEYAVLHGWQSLPDHHDSDLDISINPDDLDVLEKSLVDFGSGKLVQMLQHESSCFYFILAHKNGDGTKFVQVDAATDYRRNGLTFFPADELNGGRKKWKDFWVAAPETELAYLLVKKTLKGETPEHQKSRIKSLIEELGDVSSVDIARGLFGSELGPQVIAWIRDDNWALQESKLPELKKALFKQTVKKDPLNPVKYWLNETKRIIKRWLMPTGVFIAVLGPDGAGKSTLITELEQDMAGAFRREAVYHLRPGLLGKRGDGSPVTDPHGTPPRSYATSTIKLAYYLADYFLGYVLKIYPKMARSTMVVFDRYYDDLLVDQVRYRYGGSARLAELGSKLVPRPNLLLVLDAPEDVLLERKEEVERPELTRQRRAYLETAAKISNAYVLDAARGPAEITDDVSEITTDYLHERYMRRREQYFPENGTEKTFDWLTSVITADPQRYRFTHGKEQSGSDGSERSTYYEFKYLPVKGGRGYLLPAGKISAQRALDLYNARTRKAKALKLCIGASYSCGMSGQVMKSVRLTAPSDINAEDAKETVLFGYLKERLGIENPYFAVSLGTPGPDRKPVIQIQDGAGLVAGYAKVGWNAATNGRMKNEADTLQNFSKKSFDTFNLPEVIDAVDWRGRYVTVLSPPEGDLGAAPEALSETYVNVLKELAVYNLTAHRLNESPFWDAAKEKVKNISSGYNRNILEQKVMPLIEKRYGDRLLPFHQSHGDFAPWNTYIVNGRLFLYDWEHSSPDSPAGRDLFHFVTQTNFLLENTNSYELYRTVPADTYNGLTEGYWEQIEADENSANILFLLYLTGRLVSEASGNAQSFESMNRLSKVILLILDDGVEGF